MAGLLSVWDDDAGTEVHKPGDVYDEQGWSLVPGRHSQQIH